MKAVFDTSVIVDHLRNVEEATELLRKVRAGQTTGYISGITEAELLSGSESKNEAKRKGLLELIQVFEKITVDNEIAQKAGEFRRNYGSSLNDCIIAATAFHVGAKLLTKNVRDFRTIKEIQAEEPY